MRSGEALVNPLEHETSRCYDFIDVLALINVTGKPIVATAMLEQTLQHDRNTKKGRRWSFS